MPDISLDSDVKTRFCPSPTGLMHMGNARTALFSALLAKHAGGTFLLRIEDTDRERSDQRYTDALQRDLLWLGLQWQEGPGHDKGLGPYHQSERQPIYDDYYDRLQEADVAYACFCSEEELALQRKIQRASGKPPRYAGTCRDLTDEQVQAKIEEGLKPVLRFRVPANEKIEFDDMVHGHQCFESNDIGDFIIRRANGTSPFMFCNAIDDAMMGVKHVLRGVDHLTNTPRQLMILNALALRAPIYGHIALIVGADNSPLSKRNGSRSIEQLRNEGYLPQAVVNYMARIGHYYGHDDFLTLDQLAEQFRIDALAKSPAKFNVEQLNHWQKESVMRLSTSEFMVWLGDDVLAAVPETARAEFCEMIQPNVNFPADAKQWVDAVFGAALQWSDEQRDVLKSATKNYFDEAQKAVDQYGLDLKAITNHIKDAVGVKGKALYQPLRVALTGAAHGPELVKIIELMGNDRIKQRLQSASESC